MIKKIKKHYIKLFFAISILIIIYLFNIIILRPFPFFKVDYINSINEFNASTFTGRVCASTLSDIHSCLTAAVGSLRGPLHGGANEEAMKMLEEINSTDEVRDYIDRKLENKEN